MYENMFPFRKDKEDPVKDFWHTVKWGLIFAVLIWIVITTA